MAVGPSFIIFLNREITSAGRLLCNPSYNLYPANKSKTVYQVQLYRCDWSMNYMDRGLCHVVKELSVVGKTLSYGKTSSD